VNRTANNPKRIQRVACPIAGAAPNSKTAKVELVALAKLGLVAVRV
jgi:hypothetical protein